MGEKGPKDPKNGSKKRFFRILTKPNPFMWVCSFLSLKLRKVSKISSKTACLRNVWNTKQKQFQRATSCLNQNMISRTRYESKKSCYIST